MIQDIFPLSVLQYPKINGHFRIPISRKQQNESLFEDKFQ